MSHCVNGQCGLATGSRCSPWVSGSPDHGAMKSSNTRKKKIRLRICLARKSHIHQMSSATESKHGKIVFLPTFKLFCAQPFVFALQLGLLPIACISRVPVGVPTICHIAMHFVFLFCMLYLFFHLLTRWFVAHALSTCLI